MKIKKKKKKEIKKENSRADTLIMFREKRIFFIINQRII
jgi:hypothetical protein